MADDVVPSGVHDLSVLRSMAARLRAGNRLDPHEVERTLEAGFGALIGLEAELGRAQRASAAEPAEARAATIAHLKGRIDELRDALTDLRTLAAPRGEARVGYGFVLPGEGQRFHGSRN